MRIGIIGYGLRAGYVYAQMKQLFPETKLAAICDPRKEELAQTVGEETRFYDTPEQMLNGEKLDAIMIGTRCNLHTELAVRLLPTGIPLFLEKPVATTLEDLKRLKHVYENSRSEVVVSFPLRNTPLIKRVKEEIDAGKIGKIEHVQAVNNVYYGGVYFHNWYRDETLTGGLFLQKATHDFDYINYITGEKAQWITAMKSKQIFKGTKQAGLECPNCEEYETCPESSLVQPYGTKCCFAEDTGNEDSGSALIEYESGMHAVYTQNFFARKAAGKRGARLLGFKGTLEFDWYTSDIVIYPHHEDKEPERIAVTLAAEDAHSGGDTALIRNFVGIIRGEEQSKTPLEEGLFSALMCLKATASAEARTFQSITYE
ncbi:Gfo/Idh/MocA family protein [Paenibacillus mendelii]|uniref:Gfo/Idh/MocA family protein n=1 Tax=Paenibacillus mendelii TaxID=206163 RepID=A0ABV6JDU9_9BACL|nr:Gfo/Idh/MocA family oxidoreductase [Paenibacillus mendelii]MCQ6563530.1 Gfo/Idh/MocA family oxidoreductase [Paenibacillus mendelii]